MMKTWGKKLLVSLVAGEKDQKVNLTWYELAVTKETKYLMSPSNEMVCIVNVYFDYGEKMYIFEITL